MTTRMILLTIIAMSMPTTVLYSSAAELGTPPETTANTDQCVEVGADGKQHWIGDQSNEVKDLSKLIATWLGDYPNEGTGIANCSHYEGVIVFKTAASPNFDIVIAGARRQFPNLVVESRIVPNSLTELLGYATDLMQETPPNGMVVGAAPNIYTGGLYIYTSADSITPIVASAVSERVKEALGTDHLPIAVTVGGNPSMDSGRYSDVAPFTMGASIKRSALQTTYTCSLGIPLVLNSTHYALTAGHCGVGAWKTPSGQTVGYSAYNTMNSGTASNYGDWQLLSGFDYRKRVWASSTSYYTLTGARYIPMSVGDKVCPSGQTTGTICNFYVAVASQILTIEGVLVGHLTLLTHQAIHGAYDTQGWRHGDSGGTIYYSSSSGKHVNGIVTASDDNHLTYYYTQLDGVTARYSNIYFGGHA